jgi:hypothetical protein
LLPNFIRMIRNVSRFLMLLLLVPGASLVLAFENAGIEKPDDIDHATIIKNLNAATLAKGRQIYVKSCIACHGANGTASNPQARSFSEDKLRFGNEPYQMWQTVSRGAGMMAAQTWLSPVERYYVIQYIRETFIKKTNPSQYFKVTDQYLSKLPKPKRSADEQAAITKAEALKGSQQFGQEWFSHHTGDYGTAIHSQLKDHATAAITVLLDNQICLSYNLLRMNTTAVWRGSLNLSQTKYNRYRGEGQPTIRGRELTGLNLWQWTFGDRYDSLQQSTGIRAPFPAEFLNYHGFYAYNKDIILSYSIAARDVLEYPRALNVNGRTVLSQSLYISPGGEQKILIGKFGKEEMRIIENVAVLTDTKSGKFISAGFVSANKDIKCISDSLQRIVIIIPASKEPITVEVLRTVGKIKEDLSNFSGYLKKRKIENHLSAPEQMINGAPARWTKEVISSGELNVNKPHFDPIYREDSNRTDPAKAVEMPNDYPYTIDNIGLPFDNAYGSWIRPTCLAFKNNGDLAIGTYTGDVWMARGIDNNLKKINWQRIATSLFEPMGLKIVNDNIYVTTRNGIVLLHDLNGDGETDFYENFHPDNDISSFFHSFNFGLETDSKGNFYYTKVGEYTDNKDPGNVIKVSPDGKSWESIATGFRVDNGITIAPDDRIFVSDNQGNWEPANKICLIQKGRSYGYVPNLLSAGEWSPDGKKFSNDQVRDGVISPNLVKIPETYSQPVLWMPQEFDNSPGGGVWSDKNWGPLGNHFIHTSYGTGWVYYFLPQQVDTITQGAMIALPFQLDAGIQRAAVNPVDKQVYVVGLTGWDDPEAKKFGVLSRVRYKGTEGHLITDAKTVKGGIELSFNFMLDSFDIKNIGNYDISQWNYKWSSEYGSDHYSIIRPGEKGEDRLSVQKASMGDDGRSIRLIIPAIGPAQNVRVRFHIKGMDGTEVKNSVYMTIHKVPD